MSLQLPGKTFLVGEYAVLNGSEALVIATKPLFEENRDQIHRYHPDSAVGRFCQKNNFDYKTKINNPYNAGGFGQSTAEFLLCWWNYQNLNLQDFKKMTALDILKNSLSDYLKCYSESLSESPSGADLVSMIKTGITHVQKDRLESQTLTWPFDDLSFFVVSTGLKIKTHEHLIELNRQAFPELKDLCQNVIDSFLQKNRKDFLNHLKLWQKKLSELGFQSTDVIRIKEDLESHKKVIFVKPCGAMGVDVILVFHLKADSLEIQNYLSQKKLIIQASEQDIYFRSEHEMG